MIDVNTVYTTVLYILNKEQRGYLTPEEFNSLATQVQLEVFEKYFEDLTQQQRMVDVNDSEYANRVKTIQEKISSFETYDSITGTAGVFTLDKGSGATDLTYDLHRLGTIEYTKPMNVGFTASPRLLPVTLEEVTQANYNLIRRSKLTTPSEDWPIFTLRQNNKVHTLPSLSQVDVYYVRKPQDVRWGYTVGTLGQYIYDPTVYDPNNPPTNASKSTQFEISSLDQSEVILKILTYTGVIIRDPQIIQAASQMAEKIEVNEKS